LLVRTSPAVPSFFIFAALHASAASFASLTAPSAIEELEAINWYETRIEGANDPELKRILEHNRDEEKEHFAMLLEWLRKSDAKQDEVFKEHD